MVNAGERQVLEDAPPVTVGLSTNEVHKRRDMYGYNELKKKNKNTVIKIFLNQFKSPFLLLLISAAGIAYILQERVNALVICAIVFLDGFLGFIQEYKAERSIQFLLRNITHRARVRRDGSIIERDARELVPGDIVYLHVGDIVPADMRLVKAEECTVNEAALTGESVPVGKRAGYQGKSMVWMGTAVVSGEAVGVVLATGEKTKFNHTILLAENQTRESAFQKSMAALSKLILKITLVMAAFIFIVHSIAGRDLLTTAVFALAVAVGITPEVLPVIMTITLAKGARRMAEDHVITKRLVAIEDLGNMDVLCCDKTGTLTEGRMELVRFIDINGIKSDRVLFDGLICNDLREEKGKHLTANPVDKAIWECPDAVHMKVDVHGVRVLDEAEFDVQRRSMEVIVEQQGKKMLIMKGAAEYILPECHAVMIQEKKKRMTKEERKEIETKVRAYEMQGYHVIVVAEKDGVKGTIEKEKRDLMLVGFLLFFDPPKKTARDALAHLKELGITIKVLTGDSPFITQKVCTEIGLVVDQGKIMAGEELAALKGDAWVQGVAAHNVFARVTPEQKLRIMQCLHEKGHVVGFIGDGVNDVPALKVADVSIAVNSSAGVAKEVADIIILKKSLRVIANGVHEGRMVFGNMVKYILNTISGNFGNMVTVALSSLFLPFIPLLPVQILLQNFITDIPMIAIASDTVGKDFMEKPKKWDMGLITKFMLYFGWMSTFFDLALILPLVFIFKVSPDVFRTSWFIESVVSQILIVFALRSRQSLFKNRPSWFFVSIALGMIMVMGVLVFGSWGRKIFLFTAVPYLLLLYILGLVFIYFMTALAAKHLFFKRFSGY